MCARKCLYVCVCELYVCCAIATLLCGQKSCHKIRYRMLLCSPSKYDTLRTRCAAHICAPVCVCVCVGIWCVCECVCGVSEGGVSVHGCICGISIHVRMYVCMCVCMSVCVQYMYVCRDRAVFVSFTIFVSIPTCIMLLCFCVTVFRLKVI